MKILFLCVANSARSQLAEGLAKSLFGLRAEVQSAGSAPSGRVQPWAVRVLAEDGIDISRNTSKSVVELPRDFIENLDYVITLCAEEICPVMLTTAKKLHWPIPDPADAEEMVKPQAFTAAKRLILQKLQAFGVENKLIAP